MGWPYHFPSLTKEQSHARRLVLNRYGHYAQLSCLVPVVAYQLYRLASWVYTERRKTAIGYSAVPGSPVAKKFGDSTLGSLTRKWRKWKWWLEGEVAPGWGLREQWIGGLGWTAWLLFCCINETGDESLFLFIIDIAARKLDTVTEFAIVSHVPSSKLVKIIVPAPQSKLVRFRAAPGQHVYLSIPSESIPKSMPRAMIHELLFNPFSVANVSATDITLVVRALNGPTTIALKQLANLTKAKPPLNIEGPYGTSKNFPNLVENFDRILLVAGGVGATFILPIYQSLKEQLDVDSTSSSKITFIWSVRSAAEASWPVDSEERSIVNTDENIEVFVTRGKFDDADDTNEHVSRDGAVELEDLNRAEESIKIRGGHHRPHLQKIVDDAFSHGKEERVAILVCGPVEMAKELRTHVGDWVEKGRYVWWHDESFGW
ncbi:hypothetical protein B7463_g5497, partial [Scytalidium lignicola]